MTDEYGLFDGVDFCKVLFGKGMETSATTAHHNSSDWSSNSVHPLRPITKAEEVGHNINTMTTTPISFPSTTTTNATAWSAARDSSRGRPGRSTPSSACSSGECAFCRRNGETREFYSSHVLKDWRGMVVCPVLRAYTCPRCGATGGQAHTESHCPQSSGERRNSLMASLQTGRSSCGMRHKISNY